MSFWRIFRTTIVPATLMILFLAAFGGFAYFTRHPESPVIEEAESWPVLGEVATRFREHYLGPRSDLDPTVEGSGEGEEDDVVYEFVDGTLRPAERRATPPVAPPRSNRSDEPRRGRASPIPEMPVILADSQGRTPGLSSATSSDPEPLAVPFVAEDWRWFLPGQSLRSAPDERAEEIASLQALAFLPILGREGLWARVRLRGEFGWIDTSWQPPHSRRDARQGGLRRKAEPPRGADWKALGDLKEHFGLRRPNGRLGDFGLYTDVEDDDLLAFFDETAKAAEAAYFARFARLPSGDPLRAAAFFARRVDYDRFAASSGTMRSGDHVGYAADGTIAFYAEERSRLDLASTLVHEITHILNGRSLTWWLPPWLEEGLASDLGSVWIEPAEDVLADGESPSAALERRRIGRWQVGRAETYVIVLAEILEKGDLPPMLSVISADRKTFMARENVRVGYAYGASLVRYLLDGGHRGGFLRFLHRVADGYEPNAALLLQSLGFDEEALEEDPLAATEPLDQGFRQWLRIENERAHRDLQLLAEKKARELAG